MPRKTKLERQVELENAIKLTEDIDRNNYQKFLIETIEAACNTHEFDLHVRNGVFQLTERNNNNSWRADYFYSPDSNEELETINRRVRQILTLREREQHERELRESALNKLTEEERIILERMILGLSR